MASRVVNCPNCGGAVEFKAGASLLSVCPYCSSAVARVGDDITELEILGQVAPLAALASPLTLGMQGKWKVNTFTLIGRVQYDYGGGPWNEWYTVLDDGRWGWLSEAQGRVYLTFEQSTDWLPERDKLGLGARFRVDEFELIVAEHRVAKFITGEGEIPFAMRPGEEITYCDVQGSHNLFGTINFDSEGQAEAFFLGHELDYKDIFDSHQLDDIAPQKAAAGVGLNCPNCGAGVELKRPDEAKRVTCGVCDSLLDCSKGNELYLLSSQGVNVPEPLIPLSSQGKIDGVRWTVYGQLVKSIVAWGVTYRWTEYLLYQRQEGWRWLVESDGHWTLYSPVSAAEVSSGRGTGRIYNGKSYRRFSSGSAIVEGLRGEFYWKVALGDRDSTIEYTRPPELLSEERGSEEIHFSIGRYIPRKEIEDAFKLEEGLPYSYDIAPHQPNPHGRGVRSMLRTALALSLFMVFLALTRWALADEKLLAKSETIFDGGTKSGAAFTVNGRPIPPLRFKLEDRGNLAIHADADLSGGTLYFEGQLTNLLSGQSWPVGLLLESYRRDARRGGVSTKSRVVFLGGLSPGDYQLRMSPIWTGTSARPQQLRLKVVADVFLGTHAVVAGALLWLLPMIGAIRFFAFEKRRWSESDFAE